MNARPVKLRMTQAKANMIALGRLPRAFYLNQADFAEFVATGPVKISALFRGKPREEIGLDQVPVRAAAGKVSGASASRLFCSRGTSAEVPIR